MGKTRKGIPFVAFSNDELAAKPRATVGQSIKCPTCKGEHKLEPDDNGGTFLLFYKCGDKAYLGAVSGALVAGGCHA